MVKQRTVEERLQMIEEYLLEIKLMKTEVLQWMTAQKRIPDNLVDDYVNKYLPKHLLKM